MSIYIVASTFYEDLTKELRPNLMVNPGEKKTLESIVNYHEKI